MLFWLTKRLMTTLMSPRLALRFLFSKKPSFKYYDSLNSIDFSAKMKTVSSQYMTRFLLPKPALESLIFELKSEKYREILIDFNIKNPFVNYVGLYEIKSLNDKDIGKSIYANHWHTDDSLHVGCIKIFQLLKTISSEDGPMEFIKKDDTKFNWKKFFFRGEFLSHESKVFKYTEGDRALFLDTRSCLHKAGVPKNGNKRIMLMAQIIDKKKTEDLDKLFMNQYHKEPTALKRLFLN